MEGVASQGGSLIEQGQVRMRAAFEKRQGLVTGRQLIVALAARIGRMTDGA